MRSNSRKENGVVLPKVYSLLREYRQVAVQKDFEFLSFSPSTLYRVAQHLVDSSCNHPHLPFRLVYSFVGKSESVRIVYDTIEVPFTPLPPSTYFSVATIDVSLEDTNDFLRKVGFSTVDRHHFTTDRIHTMRLLFAGLPKYHSTWIRDEQRYALFENGVVVRPLL